MSYCKLAGARCRWVAVRGHYTNESIGSMHTGGALLACAWRRGSMKEAVPVPRHVLIDTRA